MTLAIRMAGIMASGRGGGSVRGPLEMNIEKELREEKNRNRNEIDWRSQAIGAMSSDSVKVPKWLQGFQKQQFGVVFGVVGRSF